MPEAPLLQVYRVLLAPRCSSESRPLNRAAFVVSGVRSAVRAELSPGARPTPLQLETLSRLYALQRISSKSSKCGASERR
jgi:hypothetical protein